MDDINSRDQNHVTVLSAITNDVAQLIRMLRVDPTTGRLLVSAVVAGTNNGQLKVTAADTTYGYLATKLVAGTNVVLTVVNPGGNETLRIDVNGTGYDTVEENGVAVTQRSILNFEHGFDVNDNAGNLSTDINVKESELNLGLMGGLLDLSTQVTGLLDGAHIDQSSLDLNDIGGLLDLSTQVTGQLDSTHINITNLEADLNLANIAGQINLATQVTGQLPPANIDLVALANSATFISNLEPNLHLQNIGGLLNLATQVSGTLSLANGGTGASLSDPGYDAAWVWDNTTNTTRLAHLANLTYDSASNTLTAANGGGSPLEINQLLPIAWNGLDTDGDPTGVSPSSRMIMQDSGTSRVYMIIRDNTSEKFNNPNDAIGDTRLRLFKNDFGSFYQESEIHFTQADCTFTTQQANHVAVNWCKDDNFIYAVVRYDRTNGSSGTHFVAIDILRFNLDGTGLVATNIFLVTASTVGSSIAWDTQGAQGAIVVGSSLFFTSTTDPAGVEQFNEYTISGTTYTLASTNTISPSGSSVDGCFSISYDSATGFFYFTMGDDVIVNKFKLISTVLTYDSQFILPELDYFSNWYDGNSNLGGYWIGDMEFQAGSMDLYTVYLDDNVYDGSDNNRHRSTSHIVIRLRFPKQ